ncbi:hypothetical protein D3C71_1314580 [compost metagenome]
MLQESDVFLLQRSVLLNPRQIHADLAVLRAILKQLDTPLVRAVGLFHLQFREYVTLQSYLNNLYHLLQCQYAHQHNAMSPDLVDFHVHKPIQRVSDIYKDVLLVECRDQANVY